MNQRHCFAIIFLLFTIVSHAQNENGFKGYRFTIDLTNVNNDMIKVELKTPSILKKTITYQLPKIVPGTYSGPLLPLWTADACQVKQGGLFPDPQVSYRLFLHSWSTFKCIKFMFKQKSKVSFSVLYITFHL